MAIVVLVTGACAGGWSWNKVAPLLRAAGHEVLTPTLTGLGERVHLGHPDVDLDTHITDIVNVLEYDDVRDVVLVGWSYSGMVITGVANRVPERLAQLVYLDATVPEDGQSWYDAEPSGEAIRAEQQEAAAAAGTPGFWPVPVDYIRELVTDEADQAWMLAKLTAHPLATYDQAVHLRNPAAARLPRAYVHCTGDREPGEAEPGYLVRARSEPGWRYRELAANHGAPVTAPRETAALLLSLL